MYTLQRFWATTALRERGLHEFDAWASAFGDTRTELELQPLRQYKPVTRFAQFVNVPELIAMFRSFADVVLQDDLRGFVKLPQHHGRQAPDRHRQAEPRFKAYQRLLAERIEAIEERDRRAGEGRRHPALGDHRRPACRDRPAPGRPGAAITSRTTSSTCSIDNVYRIWSETADHRYRRPDGSRSRCPAPAS